MKKQERRAQDFSCGVACVSIMTGGCRTFVCEQLAQAFPLSPRQMLELLNRCVGGTWKAHTLKGESVAKLPLTDGEWAVLLVTEGGGHWREADCGHWILGRSDEGCVRWIDPSSPRSLARRDVMKWRAWKVLRRDGGAVRPCAGRDARSS